MKFSVLIAHYNNAKYFNDCYQSLLKQTYQNWEAIILDDGSSEEEKLAVKNIIKNDSRFHWFENEKNSGVGCTKAKLANLATGDFFGFLDPDDAILPNAIEKSVEVFSKNKNVVLVYSRAMICDEILNPISPLKAAMQVPNKDKYFFNFPVQIAHFVAFRKNIYETTEKIDTSKKISEDQDIYLKMYEKGDVKYINETNYLYRTHSTGISQNENKKKSYEYWGEVIFNAMKRRGLKRINGKKIPEKFTSEQDIFSLLEYQNSLLFRIKKKTKILLQNI